VQSVKVINEIADTVNRSVLIKALLTLDNLVFMVVKILISKIGLSKTI